MGRWAGGLRSAGTTGPSGRARCTAARSTARQGLPRQTRQQSRSGQRLEQRKSWQRIEVDEYSAGCGDQQCGRDGWAMQQQAEQEAQQHRIEVAEFHHYSGGSGGPYCSTGGGEDHTRRPLMIRHGTPPHSTRCGGCGSGDGPGNGRGGQAIMVVDTSGLDRDTDWRSSGE